MVQRRRAALSREGLLGERESAFLLPSEFLVHHVITEVGDVANHAGDAQTTFGHHAVLVKIAAMKIGVGDDGAARHLIEGNVFCCQVGRAGNYHGMAQAFGVLQGPAQRLHATQAAAHYGGQCLDAQTV